jgi:hypothetical protein
MALVSFFSCLPGCTLSRGLEVEAEEAYTNSTVLR